MQVTWIAELNHHVTGDTQCLHLAAKSMGLEMDLVSTGNEIWDHPSATFETN